MLPPYPPPTPHLPPRSLPALTQEASFILICCPARMALNCDASRLAVVDGGGGLTVTQLGEGSAEQLPLERKVKLGGGGRA